MRANKFKYQKLLYTNYGESSHSSDKGPLCKIPSLQFELTFQITLGPQWLFQEKLFSLHTDHIYQC